MDKSQPTPAVQQFNEAIYILLKANIAKAATTATGDHPFGHFFVRG